MRHDILLAHRYAERGSVVNDYTAMAESSVSRVIARFVCNKSLRFV